MKRVTKKVIVLSSNINKANAESDSKVGTVFQTSEICYCSGSGNATCPC